MTFSLYAMVLVSYVQSVRRPLHRIEVDAVLVHLPERRHFPQFADLALDKVDREVDLLLRGEATNGEADGAVRQFVAAPKCTQDVRRFEARRGARGAGRYRNVLDRHDQRFALDEVEADIEVVRYATQHVAIHVNLLDFAETGPQPITQHA